MPSHNSNTSVPQNPSGKSKSRHRSHSTTTQIRESKAKPREKPKRGFLRRIAKGLGLLDTTSEENHDTRSGISSYGSGEETKRSDSSLSIENLERNEKEERKRRNLEREMRKKKKIKKDEERDTKERRQRKGEKKRRKENDGDGGDKASTKTRFSDSDRCASGLLSGRFVEVDARINETGGSRHASKNQTPLSHGTVQAPRVTQAYQIGQSHQPSQVLVSRPALQASTPIPPLNIFPTFQTLQPQTLQTPQAYQSHQGPQSHLTPRAYQVGQPHQSFQNLRTRPALQVSTPIPPSNTVPAAYALQAQTQAQTQAQAQARQPPQPPHAPHLSVPIQTFRTFQVHLQLRFQLQVQFP
ncbi:hypothetical protein ABEW05_010590 [Botrytis cinerea]